MKTLKTFESFEQPGKKFVIICSNNDAYLKVIDMELYDEISEKYGTLQDMYDRCGRYGKSDVDAKDYYDQILNSDTVDSDYIIPY